MLPCVFILILLDGSFVKVTDLLKGFSERANTIDEMLLSLLAWLFAFRPWELCSASFGVCFEFFILGVETLELLSTLESSGAFGSPGLFGGAAHGANHLNANLVASPA